MLIFFKLRNDKLFLEVCRKHYKLNRKNRNQKRLSWISGLCHKVKKTLFLLSIIIFGVIVHNKLSINFPG